MTISTTSQTALPEHVETVIVGAGFSGLCTAIKLDEAGHGDYVILERDTEVGGTWHANTYPDCACDVPSYLYSFSFAPNPDWKHAFSRQPQILEYLKAVADSYDLYEKTHFETPLSSAAWDDDRGMWVLDTPRGSLTATRLVLGAGGLSEPSVPSLPGLERFEGTTFHSARWNHDHDLSNDRVAVIGTGASAIQFVPHVQQHSKQLSVFQRTAPWVMPRQDRRYLGFERKLNRRFPALQRSARARIYAMREMTLLGFIVAPAMLKAAERISLRMLAKQVPDQELRRKLTPNFRLGCKRVLLSNNYYPALAKPNVDVVTDPIIDVQSHAIVTESPDGIRTTHDIDTIIFGTGFHVTDPPAAAYVRGRDSRTLAEHWGESGMSALNGMAITGFPNLSMLVGPNTGLGHSSIVLMIEAQVGYLVDLIKRMDARGLTQAEPTPEAQNAFNERIQHQLERTVWSTGGCKSWYLDANGRNTTLWPTFTFEFMRRLRRADLADYDVRATPRRLVDQVSA